MVLKAATKSAAAPAAAPEFENPDDEVMTAEAPAATTAPAQAAGKPATSTAVAARASGAVAVPPKPVNLADYDIFGLMKDRLPPIDFGEGVRLVGSNGNIMDGDKKMLGTKLTLTLLSWNDRYVVSPGENGAEAKEHARYSLDGITTTKGEDVKEYVEHLRKELGYDKASVKTYVDLFGILEASEKAVDYVGDAVVVSLAPDSVKAFNGFRRDIVVKGMTGRLPAIDPSMGVKVNVTTEVKSGNGNTWTRLLVSLAE